jgi:hypothetical protein
VARDWGVVLCTWVVPVTPNTVENLRAIADAAEAEGYAALDRGDRDAALAAFQKASDSRFIAARIEATRPPTLSGEDHQGTLGTMEAPQVRTRSAAVSASMIDTSRKVLFWTVLGKAKLSLPEWVARHKARHPELNENTVRSWVKRPGKGGRPAPRAWADRLAEEFDEPRLKLPRNWPNGIRE